MMQWRRIDGVNEPELKRVLGPFYENKNVILVSTGLPDEIAEGSFQKTFFNAGKFSCDAIRGSDLKWFLEIDPPSGESEESTPPTIIDTKKYGES